DGVDRRVGQPPRRRPKGILGSTSKPTSMSESLLLGVSNLVVTYDTPAGRLTAISNVSLSVERGEAVGLVGESGSGKSTIAGAVLDLLGPGARIEMGSILFEGRDLRTLTPERRRGILGNRIGSVFQDPFTSLNPSLQ